MCEDINVFDVKIDDNLYNNDFDDVYNKEEDEYHEESDILFE